MWSPYNMKLIIPKRKLRFPEHQISWVIEYAIFLNGLGQQWRLQMK